MSRHGTPQTTDVGPSGIERSRIAAALTGLPAEEAGTGQNGDFLLVTAADSIVAQVERAAAAVGATVIVAADPVQALQNWDQVAEVLVGSDIHDLPARRRAPALLIGETADGTDLWDQAAHLGAERVVILPEGISWLAEFMGRQNTDAGTAHVLGLIGASGGVGATTAACWLAHLGADAGIRTLLVDGDPQGGGLELALAAEDAAGLRWPDFATVRGSIGEDQLASSLPTVGGFAFLSWPGSKHAVGAVDAASLSGVLDAARRTFELVIIDIGRSAEQVTNFAWDCDRILFLAPPQLKAAISASRMLHELPPVPTSLVFRGRPGNGLDGSVVAAAIGVPFECALPNIRGTASCAEDGRLLEVARRRAVRKFASRVLSLDEMGGR
ncbi:septum site-determining protein Ssd [Pseudarthrobacter sp. J1763]|uniref:septum site-determining protein Ssd n=1 Tax=Pseudarthrobacter sp. J1763 TaxID=3420445 RepID=UPI003D2BBD65